MISRAVAATISALSLVLTGCAASDQGRLQAQIDALLPEGAEKSGDCNWASGFVENAPASLACRYIVEGQVAAVEAKLRKSLRANDYAVRSAALPQDAPTARLFSGQHDEFVASIGLVGPGDPLEWQLNETPVPPRKVGVFVQIAERR